MSKGSIKSQQKFTINEKPNTCIHLPKYHICSSQNIKHIRLQMLFKEYLHCLLFRENQYRLGEGGGHLHNFNWLLRCPSPRLHSAPIAVLHSYCTEVLLNSYCSVLHCTAICHFCTAIAIALPLNWIALHCITLLLLSFCTEVLLHSYFSVLHCMQYTTIALLLYCYCYWSVLPLHCTMCTLSS